MSDTRPGKSFGGEVDHRAQQLLKLLVEHYISDGTPVASKALAMLPQVQGSSATVRNVMGGLEAMGLVSSPHTSAVKVTTQLAQRIFVDTVGSGAPWRHRCRSPVPHRRSPSHTLIIINNIEPSLD